MPCVSCHVSTTPGMAKGKIDAVRPYKGLFYTLIGIIQLFCNVSWRSLVTCTHQPSTAKGKINAVRPYIGFFFQTEMHNRTLWQQSDFEIRLSVLIEMFVTWMSFCGTFQSFWDLTEVSAQSWYKVRTYDLVNLTFEISLFMIGLFCHVMCTHPQYGKSQDRLSAALYRALLQTDRQNMTLLPCVIGLVCRVYTPTGTA